jgi:biopolymer transport protein ExbD
VDAKGDYSVNKNVLGPANRDALIQEIKRAAAGMKEPVIVINADADASHQSVVRVMEAAQAAGYGRITFTIQNSK